MSPMGVQSRPSRTGFLLLFLTLVIAGLEVWGIGSSLGTLFR